MHVELVQSGDMGGAEGSACARRERVFGRGDGWHKHSEAQVRARVAVTKYGRQSSVKAWCRR